MNAMKHHICINTNYKASDEVLTWYFGNWKQEIRGGCFFNHGWTVNCGHHYN